MPKGSKLWVLVSERLRAMTSGFSTLNLGNRLGKTEARVGDFLPYARHLDKVTLLTRDGLLVQTLKVQGLAYETADDEDLAYRKQIRETLLRGVANPRLAVYHHVIRRKVSVKREGDSADPFSHALDLAWRARLASRSLYVNDLYLTLVYRPLPGRLGILERLFQKGTSHEASRLQDLKRLNAIRESFLATLAPYGAQTLSLTEDQSGAVSEPASFLSQVLTGIDRPIKAMQGDIGHVLADRRLTFGLDAIEIAAAGSKGRHFAAMISLKDYPARSAPGLLDAVLGLPHEITLSQSFAFMDRQLALGRMGLTLRRLKAADDDAFSLRDDLSQARDDVGAGRTAYGEHHLSILVRADDLLALDSAVADVQSTMSAFGGIAVREDVNMEPAFWAQFPGNFKFIARKALISVGNFASFASLHNHSQGQETGNHWGPAVTVFETTAHGPYHFNFHNGDLGNFTLIGPSGSGKTVLILFLLAAARKFNPRIVYFDKDRGAEAFIRASRGTYEVLRPGSPSGLNPLQMPDNPTNRAFLKDLLAQILGGPTRLETEDLATISDAIDANFDQPAEHRRLSYLRELFVGARRPKAGDLAARLAPWCQDGEFAWLFDNAQDMVALENPVYGFDMTQLLDAPAIRTPAMMYLFHRIEQALDGRPTLIVVDEGWKALDDEAFTSRLKDWEKTIRKRNGLVGFSTQSASDALESRIASAIVEQAATQIFMPNPKARASDYIDGFGLTEHEFELVRTLPDTSRCFLIKQADHSIVARLDLSGLGDYLEVLSGTERSVRRLDLIRAKLGDDPDDWMAPYLAGARDRAR